jgi:hypothetical protein
MAAEHNLEFHVPEALIRKKKVPFACGCKYTFPRTWTRRKKQLMLKSNLKLSYNRRSIGQSVLLQGTHLGSMTRFLSSI